MPIYEYRCTHCQKEFERIVLGGDSEVECPSCKGKEVKRLMSAAAFKCNGNFVSTGSSGSCSGCSSHSCSTCK
ncbi:MAG: FmdB family zinc ribbon protein [Thermodesulfobacteriota bacterium]